MSLRMRFFVASVSLALAVGMAAAEDETLILQQGTDGFAGFTDVSISTIDRFEAHPDGPELTARCGDFFQEGFILMRIDLSSIPPNATIRKAELSLYGGDGKEVTLSAYPMLSGWSGRTVNWVDADDQNKWTAPGLKRGLDYAIDPAGTATASDEPGWRTFDITGTAQQWASEPDSNFGMVICGNWPGWQLGKARQFASSEAADESHRPKLTITYDPQAKPATPAKHAADARPAVAPTHPRLWVTKKTLPALRAKVDSDPEIWQLVLAKCADESSEAVPFIDRRNWSGPLLMTGLADCALNYLLTGDEAQGREAVAIMMAHCDKGLDMLRYADGKVGAVHVGAVALGYDWCYDLLTADQRKTIVDQLNEWAQWCIAEGRDNEDPSSNYFYQYLWAETAVALATYGENPQAPRLLDYVREYLLETLAEPWFGVNGSGGDWPEGNGQYDGPLYLAYTLAAIKTATGEDLFAGQPFFADSVLYHLNATLPAVSGDVTPPDRRYADKVKLLYAKGPTLMYPSGNYLPNNLGNAIPGLYQNPAHTQYMTIVGWALAGEPIAERVNWWLANTPGTVGHCEWARPDRSRPLTAVVDFIFADRKVPARPCDDLNQMYHAPASGFVSWRSSWDRDATFFAFDCGPRLSRNQRRSANGMFIYKRGYLLGHVPNVRLETGNSVSMVIDGTGQTTMPRDAQPQLLACVDKGDYVYIAGDATAAYNSSFSGRKVCDSFTRQVVIIPPGLFIIFDRIQPTNPESRSEFLSFFGDRQIGNKAGQYTGKYAQSLGGPVSEEATDILLTETGWGSRAYMQMLEPQEPTLTTYRNVRLAFAGPVGADQHKFLTAVYVPDANDTSQPELTRLGDSGIAGKFNGKAFRIEFNQEGEVGGQISIELDGSTRVNAELK